jgi:hypothetical protein
MDPTSGPEIYSHFSSMRTSERLVSDHLCSTVVYAAHRCAGYASQAADPNSLGLIVRPAIINCHFLNISQSSVNLHSKSNSRP